MRTLSVEWARFGIKLCALAAGQFDTETLRTKYPPEVVEDVARAGARCGAWGPRRNGPGWSPTWPRPAGDFYSGGVITMDGARDNWFGAWPPQAVAGEEREPPAEERRPKP